MGRWENGGGFTIWGISADGLCGHGRLRQKGRPLFQVPFGCPEAGKQRRVLWCVPAVSLDGGIFRAPRHRDFSVSVQRAAAVFSAVFRERPACGPICQRHVYVSYSGSVYAAVRNILAELRHLLHGGVQGKLPLPGAGAAGDSGINGLSGNIQQSDRPGCNPDSDRK